MNTDPDICMAIHTLTPPHRKLPARPVALQPLPTHALVPLRWAVNSRSDVCMAIHMFQVRGLRVVNPACVIRYPAWNVHQGHTVASR